MVTAHNTDDNAPWCIYLAATAKDAPPANAVTVQPGRNKNIKPADLGDFKNTFLIIKSLSDVNDGSYDVEVAGIEENKDNLS